MFDPQRKTFGIADAESRVFGKPLSRQVCTHDCDARVAEPMDVIASWLVRSPVKIPEWYRHRSIRYVISRTDSRAPDAAETFEQNVVRDREHAVLTIATNWGL